MLKYVLAFLLATSVSWGYEWEETREGCRIRISLNKETFPVDELISIKVETWAAEGTTFDLPSFLENSVVSKGSLKLVSDYIEGSIIYLKFDPWVLGFTSLIFSKIRFVGEKNVEFFSDIIPIEVTDPKGVDPMEEFALNSLELEKLIQLKLNKLNDQKFDALQEEYFTQKEEHYFHSSSVFSFLWIGLLVLLILLIVGTPYLKRWIFCYTKGEIEKKDPRVLAQEALALLAQKNLPYKGEVELFYTTITDICRHYIEEVFSIQAPEQTTEEFFLALGHADFFSEIFKNKLKVFLSKSDLVKFARYNSSLIECQEAFQSVEELVYLE
jgi:hypothetical protein